MDLSPLKALDLSAPGSLIMVIGAPDSGKSTLARLIYQELVREYACVAYLDGDPGQSILGPPTTLTLALNHPGDRSFPPNGRLWGGFLGATSPRGHMLPMLVQVWRLVQAARQHGAQIVIYDTCGLIHPKEGGVALKLAEIELLRPSMLVALQSWDELETLLQPAQAFVSRIVRIPPSPHIRPRSPEQRRSYRAEKFKEYFHNARSMALSDLASPFFVSRSALQPFQLVSLEDDKGFVLALGIVQHHAGAEGITLFTPLGDRKKSQCRILRAGDLALDPSTFQERRIVLE
uniref:AAA ATPase n=1 Tax=uncultured Chloroflexota bacterium TaxID=166587 RepID=H5SM28_9CHLR|nr:AAA ATPase [uncultured Chloroflexota bacterium]